MTVIAIIAGFLFVALGAAFTVGGFYCQRRFSGFDAAVVATVMGFIVMALGGFWLACALSAPDEPCPTNSQRVRVQQLGTTSTTSMCLTQDQITQYLSSRR